MSKIGIDANGGDYGAVEVMKAVKTFAPQTKDTIVVFGTKESIEAELDGFTADNVEYVFTTEKISSEEEPTIALKQKKDSSLVKGAQSVANNEIDAFISSGSTGALVASGVFICKRLKGVARPALAGLFPSSAKATPTMMLDLGANVETKPEHLVQYSHLANIYMNKMYNIATPKIGLLNVGSEEVKGNELYKETYQLLKKEEDLNFTGNVEGRDLLSTDRDVIVVDGFAGNLVLKSIEGLVKEFMGHLKAMFKKNPLTLMSGMLLKNDLKAMKDGLDYEEIGASPVFGVKGLLLKAHGSSKEKAYLSAFRQAEQAIDKQITKELIEYFEGKE